MTCGTTGQVIHQLANGEVHHFLLPAQGWGAVVDAPQAKELAPDERASLMKWRQKIRTLPRQEDKGTAGRIGPPSRTSVGADRQEDRYLRTGDPPHHRRLGSRSRPASAELRLRYDQPRQDHQSVDDDRESPYNRLKIIMDAWCALWFWPIGQGTRITPPNLMNGCLSARRCSASSRQRRRPPVRKARAPAMTMYSGYSVRASASSSLRRKTSPTASSPNAADRPDRHR